MLNTLSDRFSKYFLLVVATGVLVVPFAASADLGSTITKFTDWAFLLINFLLVLATLVFLWGIIKYVSAGGDAAKIKEARGYILWGIIGLAIMASVWALVNYLKKTFELEGEDNTVPQDIYR